MAARKMTTAKGERVYWQTLTLPPKNAISIKFASQWYERNRHARQAKLKQCKKV